MVQKLSGRLIRAHQLQLLPHHTSTGQAWFQFSSREGMPSMPVSVIASRGETVQRFAQPDFIGAMDHPPHNPHDKLFKRTFGDPTTTANFLRHEFSEPLARAIHWDSLKLEPGSFVDSQYRSSESDLLFSTLVGDKPARIYLLFEHQRTQEPTIALRLLRYMVRIWEQFHKSNSTRPLPVILPVVLAHNAEHWEIPVSFAPLLDIPENLHGELAPFVPDFTFKLIQLADIPFDQIRGTPAGILTLRVMKAERLGMLLEDPVWDEDLVRRASLELFEQVLRYSGVRQILAMFRMMWFLGLKMSSS